MSIRPAASSDIETLLALERGAPSAAHWSRAEYERIFAPSPDALGRRLALVAEEEGVVRGFLVGRDLGSEWELENVAVAAESRRRGLGACLVEEFMERARAAGADSIFLEVRESNAAARAFYESRHFSASSRRRGYYADPPEDALLYVFSFPQTLPKNG